jgi:hypothetical protein
MLISSAILSRTVAVGVGFLLNSISKVINWSWVARWRFWFFCCWVRVLFRGGRREADPLPLAEVEFGGDGVEDILIAASSCDKSDMVGDLWYDYTIVGMNCGHL